MNTTPLHHAFISISQDGCITLEEYLVWTVRNVLCDDFLDLISQVGPAKQIYERKIVIIFLSVSLNVSH